MPILKHAKKKLKQDKKRTIKNKKIKETYKSLVKKAKAGKSSDSLSKAFSAVDKAAKQNIISKNKAAHLKSALNKQVSVTEASTESKQKVTAKKATAKATKPATKASKSTGAKKAKPTSKK